MDVRQCEMWKIWCSVKWGSFHQEEPKLEKVYNGFGFPFSIRQFLGKISNAWNTTRKRAQYEKGPKQLDHPVLVSDVQLRSGDNTKRAITLITPIVHWSIQLMKNPGCVTSHMDSLPKRDPHHRGRHDRGDVDELLCSGLSAHPAARRVETIFAAAFLCQRCTSPAGPCGRASSMESRRVQQKKTFVLALQRL